MKHIISVLVENKFGVLARIAGLFSARGYNIHSLAVGETSDPAISRMTIVVDAADEGILEQIKKQLNKLIDIISVHDFTKKEYYARELLLIKVNYSRELKHKITQVVDKFNIKILGTKDDSCVIEAALDEKQARELLVALEKIGIKELVRTGRVVIEP